MGDDQKTESRPLTIGVLVSHLTHKNDCSMWQGVVHAAGKRDVNVICFVGLWLHSPYGFEAQANVIYDLVSAERLDGLVIMAGAISQFVQPEEKKAFLERYHPLPVVTLEGGVGGAPDIYVDSLHNMRKAVRHLIQVHNYCRIAFIRGPENHQGANERYRAYVETLAEHSLPLDLALVSPPLNWYDGRQGISWLLDQQVDFEAVIGANDDLAIGAIEELHARGIRVPEEVAVVGYDDAAQSRWIAPPLTTVPIETYKWGQQALEMVLALIEGKPVPERVVIPTELAVRQSCGCMDPAVVAAGSVGGRSGQVASRKELRAALSGEWEKVVAEMAREVGNSEEASRWAEHVLDGFVAALTAEVEGESSIIFLRVLDEALQQVVAAGGDVAAWQGVISVLRLHLRPSLSDDTLLQAENLWQRARVLVGEAARREQAYQALQAEQRAQTLREIGAALITTFDVGKLMNVLAEGMPRLDIPSAYLSLYEDPQPYTYPQPAPEWSRLMLAYSERGRVELGPSGRRFHSRQLVPEGLWSQERQCNFVVVPLYFREHPIGFSLFEVGPREGAVYEVLRGNISSALQGALLLRARAEAEAALEQAYAEVEQQVAERTAELEREIEERERAQAESLRLQQEVIEAQQRAIQELSTPIIPVLEGVIVMPLIGSIDTLRARDVTRTLLVGIREHHAEVVILDITGVPIVDSGVAAYLNKTIQAARLKGAHTIVTGVSDAVAETIVDLGIDWSGIETVADLRTGLQAALQTRAR